MVPECSDGPSRITNPSRDRRVEARGGSAALNNIHQPHYRPPPQPFVMKTPPMPQGSHAWNLKTPENQMPNRNPESTSTPIPVPVGNQVPVPLPQPHLSARRVEFHSDPEEYSYRPPIVPSQGAPGLFPYRRIPLNERLPQARFPSVEVVSADPNSPRVFSNDARVLELQELRSRSGYSDNNINTVDSTTAQQPSQHPWQIPEVSTETQNLIHPASARPVDISSRNDPAVVFVGNKVGNQAGNGNYQNHSLPQQRVDYFRPRSEQHSSELLPDHLLLRQWSISSTVVSWDENDPAPPTPAMKSIPRLPTHNGSSSSALDQCSYTSPEELQESRTRVKIPHYKRPQHDHEHWPEIDGSGRNPSPDYDNRKLFLTGLPSNLSRPSIVELFDPNHRITDVSNIKLRQPRDSHGYAFVT